VGFVDGKENEGGDVGADVVEVGASDGESVVGTFVGEVDEGDIVVIMVGSELGAVEGCVVGDVVGAVDDGDFVVALVGSGVVLEVGSSDGAVVGAVMGVIVGFEIVGVSVVAIVVVCSVISTQ